MDGASGIIGGRRGGYRVLVGSHEGRRSFGRPRRRQDDILEIDLQ